MSSSFLSRLIAGAAVGIAPVPLLLPTRAEATPTNYPVCGTIMVEATMTPPEGAAGVFSSTLKFTNVSSGTCVIVGQPTLQGVVHGAGEHLIGESSSAHRGDAPPVSVPPGQTAVAGLRMTNVANLPAPVTPIDGFAFTFPETADRGFVAHPTVAPIEGSWLQVGPLNLQ